MDIKEKKATMAEYLALFAKDVATVGFMIRTEEEVRVDTMSAFSQDIAFIAAGCIELRMAGQLSGEWNFGEHLYQMSQAIARRDMVALADIMEYELLNHCEELLECVLSEG